jgi:hypothetical protein
MIIIMHLKSLVQAANKNGRPRIRRMEEGKKNKGKEEEENEIKKETMAKGDKQITRKINRFY